MDGSERRDGDVPRRRRLKLIAATVVLIALLLLILQLCSPDPSEVVEAPPNQLPAETVDQAVALEKPICGADDDCVVVGRLSPGHRGERVDVLVNPKLDDPVANWARCLDSFVTCVDSGRALDGCLTEAPCDEACTATLAPKLAAAGDVEAGLDLFERTFVLPDAACYPNNQARAR